MQAHYRSVLDISNEAMIASEKGFQRLMEAMNVLELLSANGNNTTFNIEDWKSKCHTALLDDFNAPILIAHLFEAVKFIFALKDGKESISETDLILLKETLNRLVFDVLGLQKIEENNNEKLDQALQILINLRNEARKAKIGN